MDLFWPDHAPQAARGNMDSMLRYVRDALQTLDSMGRTFIACDGPFYSFRPFCPYVVDIQQFRHWIDLARQAPAESEERITDYCMALQLYRGQFLPELYYDWVTREQNWLEEAYLNASRALAEIYLLHGHPSEALELAHAMFRIDPCCEEAEELMIQAHGPRERHRTSKIRMETCRHVA